MAEKYQQKENSGSMFFNEHKQKDTDRDFQGTINVGGVVYWISGWKNTSKSNVNYIGLSVQLQEARPRGGRGNFPDKSAGRPKAKW